MADACSAPLSDQAQSLLEVLDCGVVLFDDQGRICFWNRWMERFGALSERQARGRPLAQAFPEAAPALLDAVQAALSNGMSSLLANQLHRHPLPLFRPGAAKPMEQTIQVRPLRQAGLGCLMQVNDVSAAVRREHHLRENEAALRLRNRAVEASSQGVVIADAEHPGLPIIYANSAFAAISGYDQAEVLGRDCRFLHGEDGAQPEFETIASAIEARCEVSTVVRSYRKDGTPFWNELTIAPVMDHLGKTTHFVGIHRDITRRRQAEDALKQALIQEQEARTTLAREKTFIQAVLQTVGALVAVVDRRGRIIDCNRAFEMTSGRAGTEVRGQPLSDLLASGEMAPMFRLDMLAQPGSRTTVVAGLRDSGGETRTVEWTLSPLEEADGGAPKFLICTGIDVTERRLATALLRAERRILEMIARAEPLPAILETLAAAVEEQVAGGVTAVLLLDSSGGRFSCCLGARVPADLRRALETLRIGPAAGSCGAAAFTGQPVYTTDIHTDPKWNVLRDFPLPEGATACWAMPILNPAQAVLGNLSLYHGQRRPPRDAEIEVLQRAAHIAAVAIERNSAEARIRFLALHDPLTGLANRTLLTDRLQATVRHARRAGETLGLLFIDLDGFKLINDSRGHDAGDEVLSELGHRLAALVRESDTAARIGGDEFVVLLHDIRGAADAEMVAGKLLEALSQPVTWQGHDLAVSASIGIALFPEDAETADGLLTCADDAMYLAKQAGKNRFRRRDRETGP